MGGDPWKKRNVLRGAINTTGRLHRTNNQSGLKRMEEASLSFDNLIYSPVDKQSGKMNSHGEIILLRL